MNPHRGRTRIGTEERVVEAARRLFFRHGIKRVPVEEICQEAGVSKMTFYRHFPDKTAVALRVLEDIVAGMRRQMRDIEMEDAPFEVKLKQILETRLEQARATGKGFFTELLKGADPALERFVEDEKLKSVQQVRNIFLTAQRMGELRKDVKVDLILHMLNSTREALRDERLLGLYPDLPALMQEALGLFSYGALRR
ncbi:MAG: TetR/AcrR family transcriptional regulator [Elusimicrobia bacterium]|nr:TetR/AcrR family transcriptional regulator [Elusimicrobiota bacterium]